MELVADIIRAPSGAAEAGREDSLPADGSGSGAPAEWALPAGDIPGAVDGDLVKAALADQKEAFNELIRRYARMLLWHVSGLVSPPLDAEEVVQESIVRAYAGLTKLWPPKAFPRWLLGIARNVALEAQRAAARTPAVDVAEIPIAAGQSGDPQEELQRKELRARLLAETSALPDHYKVVLALKYMRGYSVDEIAEQLQMPPGSVRSRLSRAYALLRRRLGARATSGPAVSEEKV